ncbi:unnamed protein product [Rangifer tarandus platyrhynchus]|uniref:Uncharacterized protein n=2 Tax=Rangifer tarandus platyrhynchus TaxID=3082113 RepID=A0AC59YK56_RANTA|nr:unnamed protein product [Rangifer tarandus platyrhynchus]
MGTEGDKCQGTSDLSPQGVLGAARLASLEQMICTLTQWERAADHCHCLHQRQTTATVSAKATASSATSSFPVSPSSPSSFSSPSPPLLRGKCLKRPTGKSNHDCTGLRVAPLQRERTTSGPWMAISQPRRPDPSP